MNVLTLGTLLHCRLLRDIINRRNSLCDQVNNVLSYFGGLGIVTELKLLYSYCSSFMAVNYRI